MHQSSNSLAGTEGGGHTFQKERKGHKDPGENGKFAACLPQQAFDVDDFFRLLRGTGTSLPKKWSQTKGRWAIVRVAATLTLFNLFFVDRSYLYPHFRICDKTVTLFIPRYLHHVLENARFQVFLCRNGLLLRDRLEEGWTVCASCLPPQLPPVSCKDSESANDFRSMVMNVWKAQQLKTVEDDGMDRREEGVLEI